MKKIAIVLLTATVILTSQACKKAIESYLPDQNQETPTSTDVGTPVGTATTKNIGSSGGTLLSTDGKFELEIPAGALTGNTDIAIQPITNNAPNGVSNAYRFTPEGLTFSNPVTLKIHYADNDAAATLPDLMGIAFQDHSGIWYRLNNFTNDAYNKILSAPITHFSDWTLFDVMNITPSSATIKVNQTLSLEVTYVNAEEDTSLVSPLLRKIEKIIWFVNNIENGSTAAGSLTAGTDNDKSRIYKAPSNLPTQNPVAVSAQVQIKFNYHGKTFDKTSLVSNIKIFDGDEVYLLEIKLKESNWFPGILATDSVSMRVKIQDTTVTVYNISNFSWKSNPEMLVSGNITIAWVPDPDAGPINITGGTGDIAIDYLGPNTRFLGLHFTHSDTHNPRYHKTIPPNFDDYWGGEATLGDPGGCSFNLISGQAAYDNGNNDVETVRLTLQQ